MLCACKMPVSHLVVSYLVADFQVFCFAEFLFFTSQARSFTTLLIIAVIETAKVGEQKTLSVLWPTNNTYLHVLYHVSKLV